MALRLAISLPIAPSGGAVTSRTIFRFRSAAVASENWRRVAWYEIRFVPGIERFDRIENISSNLHEGRTDPLHAPILQRAHCDHPTVTFHDFLGCEVLIVLHSRAPRVERASERRHQRYLAVKPCSCGPGPRAHKGAWRPSALDVIRLRSAGVKPYERAKRLAFEATTDNAGYGDVRVRIVPGAPTPKYATAPGRYGLAALNTHEPRAVRPTLTSQPDHRMSAKVGLPQGGATPNRAVAQDVAFVDRLQHAKWPLNDH